MRSVGREQLLVGGGDAFGEVAEALCASQRARVRELELSFSAAQVQRHLVRVQRPLGDGDDAAREILGGLSLLQPFARGVERGGVAEAATLNRSDDGGVE